MNLSDNNVPLRVAYVLKRFPRFSETFILNELLELQQQGVNLSVFSLLCPPDEQRHAVLNELNCPVYYLPKNQPLSRQTIGVGVDQSGEENLLSLLDIERSKFNSIMPGKDDSTMVQLTYQALVLSLLLGSQRIHHIHAHFCSNATTVAMLASRMTQIPYSFTAHARDIYHQYTDKVTDDDMRRRKIVESSFVATVSDYNQKHLQNLVDSACQNKVKRLYNGINQHKFNSVKKITNQNHMVAVGRLVEKKGFKYLIEACRILHSQGHDFKLSLIGNGPELESLKHLIETYRLEQIVTLAGALPQEIVIDVLNSASLMVLPCVISDSGDRDGLPTVLLEAMSMGLPVVSTRVAGIPEIIDHGVTGLIANPNDAGDLAVHLQTIIKNKTLAAKMGKAGRCKAKKIFNLQTNVTQLAEWFYLSANQAVRQYCD